MVKKFGADDWMKKARVFVYTRISTAKQTADDRRVKDVKKKSTLKRQKAEIDSSLKTLGLPKAKAGDWYAEIASGTRADRPEWLKMMSDAKEAAMGGKRVVIVVKDPSRWARDVDVAVEAWAPLKRMGIPILAVTENIQTGTTAERRPDEALFFLIKQGFAAQVSDVQKEKAKAGVERQLKEGALAGKGQSLYPFAKVDPLDVLIDNYDVLKERGGGTLLKNKIDVLSNPNGMSATAVNRERAREEARRKNLSPEMYRRWYEFRKGIREILQEADSDPFAAKGNRTGKLVWEMNALMRMVGLYLKEPWKHPMPSDQDVDAFQSVEFLSDKDKNRRAKK